MKSLLLALFSVLVIFLNPQDTILSIKSSSSGITGKMSENIYQQDRLQIESFVSILNSDVLEYYNLKNLYNTDSKRKTYIESEDYKSKHSKLMELRNQMISATYYLDFKPDLQSEKSIALKYDPDTRSFSLSNAVSLSSFYNEPEYIQFDQILFKCPAGMTIETRNTNYVCVPMIEEIITSKIDNDVLGSKIEENKNYLSLLFVFNITGIISTQGKTLNLISSDYSLITDLRRVVVYNSNTNEIYSTFK
jgi:hypothetical protein